MNCNLVGATNVAIEPFRTNYQLGDELVCSADGNPPPTIQWKNLLTGNVINDREIVIRKSLTNSLLPSFQCIASNYVAGNLSITTKNISFTIQDNADHGTVLIFCILYIFK